MTNIDKQTIGKEITLEVDTSTTIRIQIEKIKKETDNTLNHIKETDENQIDPQKYSGHREILLETEEISDLYNHQSKNGFKKEALDIIPNINEYIIIKGHDTKSDILLKFDGKEYINVEYTTIPGVIIDTNNKNNNGQRTSIEESPLATSPSAKVKLKKSKTEIIKPKNLEQKLAFDLLQNNDIKIKLLFGAVGSGKTMLLVKYALQQICEGNFKKIMRIRNNEEPSDSNNIGFLKGDKDEKLGPWAGPLMDHLGGKENLEKLVEAGVVEIECFNFLQGRSLKDIIVICDECQNTTAGLMSMLIGRLEESSILLLSGDLKQNNNPQKFRNNGLEKIIKKLVEKQRKEFGCIKLQKTERSEVAKLAEDLL